MLGRMAEADIWVKVPILDEEGPPKLLPEWSN